jgi:RNA polymerase sigma-70 factor (ECF subfamily)
MAQSADEVIAEYGPALARISASYERNRALREELLQEILLAIVLALPRLKDPSKLKAYVFRIAHNRAVGHVLQRVREPAAEPGPEPDEIAAAAPTQEQSMIASQRSHALLHAIQRLALPYRQVITLVLEDLTHPEIAEVLGISVVNVGVRVSRAKQQLKGLLDHGR